MTNDSPENSDRRKLFFALGFALLIVVVYLTGLSIPLLGPDEPRYAQVAREMFERGDWITPTLGGFDWFEKPALLYWLEIASFHLFGVNEFAARFGSALFGIGTVAFLWLAGREAGGRKFADILAIISASSLGLLTFSRGGSFDIILTFPIAASMSSYYIWDKRERGSEPGRMKFLVLFYAFAGLALIGKGLVGIVFPYAIVAFYYVIGRRLPSKAVLLSVFWGTVVCLAVASLWYVPMYHANGWKFIDEFFIQHHFQRYTSNKYLHPQPFWFFFVVLPLMTLPWLPFFFSSLWTSLRDKLKGAAEADQFSSLGSFAAAWLIVPLAFFSFSGSKLPGYILPVVPAAMILTAFSVYRFAERSRVRRTIVVAISITTLVVSALLAKFVIADFIREETVHHLVATANERGYRTEKILNMHTISHSVEFYGAGRLVREPDGKQRKFFGVSEIVEQMNRNGTTQELVIVPVVYLYTLNKPDLVEAEKLDDNGELAIVVVKKK